MKKQIKAKSTATPKKREPDLEGFMIKVQEQLAALATKMDAWIDRIPAISSEGKAHPAPVQPAPLAPRSVPQTSPGQSFQRPPAHQVPGEGRRHGRRERALFKAVCADCHKDCEIPFKPSGERPVYCKPCFSKRKAGNSPRVENVPVPSANIEASAPAKVDRRVVVTKKGVGKVTVSEIIRPAPRAFPSRDKSQKPAQRAKK